MSEEKSNARVQWEKMKDLPKSEKLRYILQYYWYIPAILGFILLLVLMTMVFLPRGGNKYRISGVLMNMETSGDTAAFNELLAARMNEDPTVSRSDIVSYLLAEEDPAMQYDELEGIIARISAGDLDFICGDAAFLVGQYLDSEDYDACSFSRLEEILPDELLNDLTEAGRIFSLDTTFGGKVPFLINISDSPVAEALDIPKGDYYVAAVCTTKRKAAFIAMCELLIYENETEDDN